MDKIEICRTRNGQNSFAYCVYYRPTWEESKILVVYDVFLSQESRTFRISSCSEEGLSTIIVGPLDRVESEKTALGKAKEFIIDYLINEGKTDGYKN